MVALVRDKKRFVPLSGPIIKEEAVEYGKYLGNAEFNESMAD